MAFKKIHIMVDEDEWNKFLEFIRAKHGKVKGMIWTELNNAIRSYMGQSTSKSQLTKSGLTPSKTLRIVDAIAKAIIDKFKEGKTVTPSWITEFIKLNISPSPTVIERYMNYFKEVYTWSTWDNRYIKPWTFRRKDSEPLWKSENEYLEWLHKNGLSDAWIKHRKEIENIEISEILNAAPAD